MAMAETAVCRLRVSRLCDPQTFGWSVWQPGAVTAVHTSQKDATAYGIGHVSYS